MSQVYIRGRLGSWENDRGKQIPSETIPDYWEDMPFLAPERSPEPVATNSGWCPQSPAGPKQLTPIFLSKLFFVSRMEQIPLLVCIVKIIDKKIPYARVPSLIIKLRAPFLDEKMLSNISRVDYKLYALFSFLHSFLK